MFGIDDTQECEPLIFRPWPLPKWNMSINVEVGLLSGKTTTLTVDLNEGVRVLKLRAQVALGVGTGAVGGLIWQLSG